MKMIQKYKGTWRGSILGSIQFFRIMQLKVSKYVGMK